MKKAFLAPLALASIFFAGCSTILTEDTHKINVSTSNGQKITVSVDGQSHEVPGIVAVTKANQDKTLTTTAENCTKVTQLNKGVETEFFINVISGGAFGSTTDYATEKMWKYDDSVVITCQ